MSFTGKKTTKTVSFSLFLLLFYTFSLIGQPLSDSAVLTPVVIQATRAGSNSSVPHTNIKAEAISRSYQAQDIPFLLSGVPSLIETSDAGAGVGYTGLRIRGSDPTRVNVTINGVPLNDAESQAVYWVNLPDLAASAKEIQVQRGVGSSTNGAGAFGATVNLDLSGVTQEPEAALVNSVGSYGLRKHSLSLNSGLFAQKRLSFSARLSQIQSEGYVDRASAELRSTHISASYIGSKQSLQGHLLWGREKTYQAWYGLPAQYYDAGILRTHNVAGTERPGAPHPNEIDHYTQRHHLLHYRRQLRRQVMLQLNGHYTRGYGYYEQYKARQEFSAYRLPHSAAGDSIGDLIRRRWLDNHFYGITWAMIAPVRAHKLTLGGAVSRYTGRHFGTTIWTQYYAPETPVEYYSNNARKDDANLFIQWGKKIGHRLNLDVDLQYRQVWYHFLGYNIVGENVTQTATLPFFNPKAGFQYALNSRFNWTFFAGMAHREPNRDDYTQSSPDSRPKAERLYNIENAIKVRGRHWQAQVNGFGMYYRDQLVLDGRINDVGAYIRTNVPKSYRAGVEIEGRYRPTTQWEWNANMTFSRNKVVEWTEYRDNWDTGAQASYTWKQTDLAFSPNFLGRIEITRYWGAHQPFSLTWASKWVGKQYLDNTGSAFTQLNAYNFSDLRVNYAHSWKHLSLQCIASVNNITNTRYASNGWIYRFQSAGYDPRPEDLYARKESGDDYHLAGYFPQAGRNYMMTVKISLKKERPGN